MSAARRTRQGGWTLWETVVGICLLSILMVVVSEIFSSSDTLVRDTRAKHRAEEALRRSLEALSNVVRDAALATLDGFDAGGTATNPTFARVTGVDDTGRTYGPLEELCWRPSDAAVPGIDAPGRVVHVSDGREVLVADRVPSGGFSVWLDGDTLVLAVRTYYVVRNHLEVVEGSTAVALRN